MAGWGGSGASNGWQTDVGVDARPLALLRIALGALVVFDLGDRLRDFHAFYTAAGLVPLTAAPERWSLLGLSDDPNLTLALYLLALPAALLVLLGLFTRAALAATLVALISLHHRNPYVEGGGDAVLRALIFWMVFVDAGACLSLDVALGRRTSRAAIPAWPVHLLQLQIATVYLFAYLGKTGPAWRDGSAIWLALTTSDWARGAGPWLASHPAWCRCLSYLTLGIEAAFAPLVFWPRARQRRRLRALILAAGLVLHIGIFCTMRVGIFSQVMVLSYLAFVPAAWLDRFIAPVAHGSIADAAAVAGPGESPHLTAALLAAFALILSGQVATIVAGAPPRPLARTLEFIGMRQDWRVFAPDAPHLDIGFTAPGILANGQPIDLTKTILAPLTPQHAFRYTRWHRLRNMLATNPADLLLALGRYTCRRQADNDPPLQSFELHAHIQDRAAPNTPPRDELRLRQTCTP